MNYEDDRAEIQRQLAEELARLSALILLLERNLKVIDDLSPKPRSKP